VSARGARAALGFVLAVAPVGCHACIDETVHGPKVKGPIKAEFIVKKQAWLMAGRSAPSVDGIIRIEAPAPQDYYADCHEPDRQLQEDPGGTRLAYRCADSEEWRILHLTPKGGLYRLCRTHAPADSQVDWDAVPDLVAASKEIFACASDHADAFMDETIAADLPRAVGVLEATQDEELGPNRVTGDDAWLRSYAKLPEAARGELADAVIADLEATDAKSARLWRAIVVARERVPKKVLLENIDRIAALQSRSIDADLVLAVGAHMLLATEPERVGGAACKALTTGDSVESYRGVLTSETLTAVLAKSKVPCPDLVKTLGCSRGYACGSEENHDEHVCRLDEIMPGVDKLLAQDPMEAARSEGRGDAGWAILATAYQTNAVPEGFLLQNERLLYRQEPELPNCFEVTTRGAPCRCIPQGATLENWLCVAATQKTATSDHCVMEFDDAKRLIHGKQQCSQTELCQRDVDCCEGRCVNMKCDAAGAMSAAASGAANGAANASAPSSAPTGAASAAP
jgi:hypothetical protein